MDVRLGITVLFTIQNNILKNIYNNHIYYMNI